jgi:hypothetical protein
MNEQIDFQLKVRRIPSGSINLNCYLKNTLLFILWQS